MVIGAVVRNPARTLKSATVRQDPTNMLAVREAREAMSGIRQEAKVRR